MEAIIKKAVSVAKAAARAGEVPIAAVIFDSDTLNIESWAANQTENKNNACLHAEMSAIAKACKKLKCRYLAGKSIYVTLEPCPMCATAISYAKLDAVYYGAEDKKGGGVDNGCKVYANQPNLYKPKVTGGINAVESAAILSDFFKQIRQASKENGKKWKSLKQ